MEDVRYNEIKNTIKIWPYLDDISQTIFPYTFKYLSNDPQMVVNLDFSNVKRINSSISAITLKKIVSLVISEETTRFFKIIMPEDQIITSFLQDTGFLSILDDYCHFNKYSGDLFDVNVEIQKTTNSVINRIGDIKKTSFPLYCLKYNEDDPRESVNVFSEWFDDNVLSLLEKYSIRTDVLFAVITELAKNSLDHTCNDAFFGIDVVENTNENSGELLFSCSDLGMGISQNVREHLRKNPQKDLRFDVWRHASLTDMYKWAFTLGNTTSKNSNNKGIGMTMIIDGVQELKMELMFFDARSMMQIPDSQHYSDNSLSHEALRRKSWNTENKVGFYYYGRLKF
ncbi:MAG: hypothetical protein IKQ09_01395 [Bacteroidales bacterium]|nr:hypothetical protein [Bacteroidales bacterium]